ncbi:hypothetical protein RRG08_019763 [Elysia crispata]|uniref:Uncharacterized protein n=1 Tax=Elysia crispata TaxID=231223 RepID=A0AAE1E6U0_9GAST|nr:hypothetical protein RRG08_019763 [Elysia crispata]
MSALNHVVDRLYQTKSGDCIESSSGPTIPDKSSRPDLTRPSVSVTKQNPVIVFSHIVDQLYQTNQAGLTYQAQCERNKTKSGDCIESYSGPTIPDKSSRPDLTNPSVSVT